VTSESGRSDLPKGGDARDKSTVIPVEYIHSHPIELFIRYLSSKEVPNVEERQSVGFPAE
jgi:hypothetical protein